VAVALRIADNSRAADREIAALVGMAVTILPGLFYFTTDPPQNVGYGIAVL
jgi:hypothetical protein